MLDLQISAYVSERDIDLLLLEEFHVSADFRTWFVANVFGPKTQCVKFIGAWHSVSHSNLGESDLILQFLDEVGDPIAILIEDKIDALPQPEQGARYQLRGQEGLSDGLWRRFRSCIVAPQAYLTATADASHYDACVSYESIRDWFLRSSNDTIRLAYKASIVQEGIEQNRRGYQRTPDPIVTQFFASYWQFASTEFPQLQMDHPGPVPARTGWVQFKDESGLWIRHKLEKGTVELAIPSSSEDVGQLALWNAHLLVEGLEIVPVGKSAAFSLLTPKVDRWRDLASQAEAVRTGLNAVMRLKSLVSEIDLVGVND